MSAGNIGPEQAANMANWGTSGMYGDLDGWVLWTDHSPSRLAEIEIKRGDEPAKVVRPKNLPEEWNAADVMWRPANWQ